MAQRQHVQQISQPADRIMAALVAGLELEFGRCAGEALAHRFLAAEECDFAWDARGQERWLGCYDARGTDDDDDDILLDRVAIFGRLDGKRFVATMIVDGEGQAHAMLGKREFASENEAREAFLAAC